MSTPKQAYDRERYLAKKAAKPPPPVDPISLIGVEDLCYLAGLIDGEGSIYCAKNDRPSRRHKTCYPVVTIGMTHQGVVQWVAALWGVEVSTLHKRKNPRWLPQYFARLQGKRAQHLCRVLVPYLRVKRRQAELVCEFQCEARIAPGKPLSNEINRDRFRLRDTINALNHAPRNPAAERHVL